MEEKRAVVTLCIGETAERYAEFTHQPMKEYAKRLNADFIVYNKQVVNFKEAKNFNPLLFEKYQVHDTLGTYDRVLFLDTDILVTPNAPDIFKITPVGKIGCVLEDFGTEMDDRRKIIKKVQEVLGDVDWSEGFMNSGVFVVSKIHRDVFRMYKVHGFYDGEYEQTNTNWYIKKAGFEFFSLNYKFNFMGLMRVYYGPEHREAYFIHYAGKGGLFPWVEKIEQVKNDYEFFYENKNVKSFEEL
ncbi:MAG: glycosyltransferase [Candidatus Hodarchaeota archaeon]